MRSALGLGTLLVMALACAGGDELVIHDVTVTTPGAAGPTDEPATAPSTATGPMCCRARGKAGEADQFSDHSPGCSKATATFGTGIVGAELDQMVAAKLHPFEEYRGPECEVVCCDMSSNPMSKSYGEMTRGECTKYRGEAPGRCLNVPGAKTCDTAAIVADPDPAGLNVRDAPSGKKVLTQVHQGAMLTLTASKDGWVYVASAWDPDRDTETEPKGWVSAKLLTTDIKHPDEYGSGAPTGYYDSPYGNEVSFRGGQPMSVKLLGCEDGWLQAEMKLMSGTKRGWLSPGSFCSNPATTCP